MTPGTFIFDPKYPFDDGTTGEKLFVLLNDGACGYYLTAKTTSVRKPEYRGTEEGCQRDDTLPNYFLRWSRDSLLKENTWILLEKFRRYSPDAIHGELREEGRMKLVAVLDDETARDLILCASYSQRLRGASRKMLQQSLSALALGKR